MPNFNAGPLKNAHNRMFARLVSRVNKEFAKPGNVIYLDTSRAGTTRALRRVGIQPRQMYPANYDEKELEPIQKSYPSIHTKQGYIDDVVKSLSEKSCNTFTGFYLDLCGTYMKTAMGDPSRTTQNFFRHLAAQTCIYGVTVCLRKGQAKDGPSKFDDMVEYVKNDVEKHATDANYNWTLLYEKRYRSMYFMIGLCE